MTVVLDKPIYIVPVWMVNGFVIVDRSMYEDDTSDEVDSDYETGYDYDEDFEEEISTDIESD
jgi:hypothetical protein